MSWKNQALVSQLNQFTAHYTDTFFAQKGHFPLCEKDEQWPSACEQGIHDDVFNYWKPTPITSDLTFENVESALAITLHPDIKTYFTTLYSDHLRVTCEEGELSLLFAWNAEDFERLQENIIGHILMKQKLKQKITLFFAVTDDDDYILSLNNESGEVWVERVGCEPHKKIADTLAVFFQSLSPAIDD